MRTQLRKPSLPLHAGKGAMFPRLYNTHGIALDPAEVEWVARVVNASPDVATLRRALRHALEELQAQAGGPKDQTEEEAVFLQEIRDVLKTRRKA